MSPFFKRIFLVFLITLAVTSSIYGQNNSQKDSINLRYDFKNTKKGGLYLDDLAKKEIIFDKLLNKYVIVEKIGNYATRTPIYLTPKEYQQYR